MPALRVSIQFPPHKRLIPSKHKQNCAFESLQLVRQTLRLYLPSNRDRTIEHATNFFSSFNSIAKSLHLTSFDQYWQIKAFSLDLSPFRTISHYYQGIFINSRAISSSNVHAAVTSKVRPQRAVVIPVDTERAKTGETRYVEGTTKIEKNPCDESRLRPADG